MGITIYRIVPQKIETHQFIMTVGGGQIDCPGEVSTPTNDSTTIKSHNSMLSSRSTKGSCETIRDFYLNTDMERFKYKKVKVEKIQK